MKTKIFIAIGSLCTIFVILLGVILIQNDFAIREKKVVIPTSNGVLKGTLALPKKTSEKKLGLVVFIHGDGPTNASYDDNYKPLWEHFVKKGYACLSWNKPGIEGSEENWLLQSMDDRAKEANEVLTWAQTLPEIDASKIGLWGASQAGWVIPKIVQLNPNIAFSILVAPAINWIEQGKYNTLEELRAHGATPQEIKEKEKIFDEEMNLLKQDASYERYVTFIGKQNAVSKDRWTFIKKNYTQDATEDIRHFYSPTKLILGKKDIHVDSKNTEEIYEKEVPANLLDITVIADTNHFMLQKPFISSNFKTFFVGLFAPRELAHKQYWASIETFLDSNVSTTP